MSDLQDTPDAPEPSPGDVAGLRFLRVLVTVLTATMIVGIVAMVALLYTRLPGASSAAAPPALPESLALPEGAVPQAVTSGQGWWAVVTEAGDILLFDADGALLRRIQVAELARN